MTMPSILEYDEFKSYFSDLQSRFPGKKRKLTLNEFSDLLGYKSPRTVGMVMTGKRLPSPELTARLQGKLKLTPKESLYLQLLIRKAKINRHAKKSKSANDQDIEITEQISKLRKPAKKIRQISSADFQKICDWYFGPLMMLISGIKNPDFNSLEKTLKNKVSRKDLESGYLLLKEIGVLDNFNAVQTTSLDIPSVAIRFHHTQMMDRAAQSLNEDLVTDREFVSQTFKMNSNRLIDAKKRLRDFFNEFLAEFHDDAETSVYQMNSQLFRHTKE